MTLIPLDIQAASLAVGASKGRTYPLRCMHPPGGATALVAVVGGSEIEELGFQFVLTPVALNVTVISIVAIAFNYAFPRRHYRVWVSRQHRKTAENKRAYDVIEHSDPVYALSQLDSSIAVSENDLLKIYALAATRRHRHRRG